MTPYGNTAIPTSVWGVDLVRESDAELVRMILDRPYVEAQGCAGEMIRGTVAAPWVVVADDVLLDSSGQRFSVVTIQPAMDRESAVLVIKSEGYRLDIVAGDPDGVLQLIYIDQEYPLWPAAAPGPPTADPTLVDLRLQPTPQKVLASVVAITPTVIPAHARIDSAELWAYCQVPVAGPTWSTHRVLQAMSVGFTNWNNYAKGRAWHSAGCGTAGTDYEAASICGGAGMTLGWQRIAYGQAFSQAVAAGGTGSSSVILRPLVGPGTIHLMSQYGDNGDLRPYLRVWYTLPRV